MLTPFEFGRVASTHGTVAVVADPHEIANVLGVKGIDYMIDSGNLSGLKFYFGVPSCVPATIFESSGAFLNAKEVCQLLSEKRFKFLSEMMNFPGVILNDVDVISKINCAKKNFKPIDGHCPALTGENLEKYIDAGISTDHECENEREALEKLKLGMNILIREGSAAKNFNSLLPVLKKYSENCMFCSDDLHPDDLENGHINLLVKKALKNGVDLFSVLRVASFNPIKHYGLDVGLLQNGDSADFIIVDNLKDFSVIKTVVNGDVLVDKGKVVDEFCMFSPINNFNCEKKQEEDFKVIKTNNEIKVIKATESSLFTDMFYSTVKAEGNFVSCNLNQDILKIAVVNRYENKKPAVAFINGFGLKKGAIASSVAHDSHNIVVVGVDDISICNAVNLVIENKGGLAFWNEEESSVLPLPVCGIISLENFSEIATKYKKLNKLAEKWGTTLQAPFMTLSFMALPVIPKLKITDKGLFDVDEFKFTSLFN